MAKTVVRGTQIADGANGVDLTVDVFGVLPSANGGVTAPGASSGRFYRDDATWQSLLLTDLPDAWVKRSCKAATTANITLSAPQTIDTISVVAGDRVLVKNQTTGSQNGIYVVAAGAWTRALDADTASEIAGGEVNIDSGSQGGKTFKTTFKTTDTLATTTMTWIEMVDLSSVQTLTNKILTAPKVDIINDTGGAPALGIIATASAVNYLEVRNQISGALSPVIAAVGTDANLNINLLPKGVGQVLAGSAAVLTDANTKTVTNKTLSTGTKVGTATTDISGSLTAYTPTLTNFSVGTTGSVLIGAYMVVGKMVFVRVHIVGGTGAAATGICTISVPTGTRAAADDQQMIPGRHFDGTTNRPAWHLVRSTGFLVQSTSTGTWLSTFASGHVISLEGWYEIA